MLSLQPPLQHVFRFSCYGTAYPRVGQYNLHMAPWWYGQDSILYMSVCKVYICFFIRVIHLNKIVACGHWHIIFIRPEQGKSHSSSSCALLSTEPIWSWNVSKSVGKKLLIIDCSYHAHLDLFHFWWPVYVEVDTQTSGQNTAGTPNLKQSFKNI